MSKGSFFAELKRRNVLRVGMFYAGGVWALTQGLAQLFPAFGVPDWVVRWLVIAGVIGFPFVLIFAWFYEFTAEGLKLESDLEDEEVGGRRSGNKKMDRWIIAVLALAVVLLLTNQFVLRKDSGADASAEAPPKSVAVLPFENLSADPSNKYFVSGMQDMILTKLADVGDLKVISRTSTEKYKSRPDDLNEVGSQLGVATVLEGSVQKAGNQVLINVQLVDVKSGSHLWANAYTKSLDNIFDVEGEVAQSVADALKAKLTPVETTRITTALTQNKDAYEAYFHGEDYLHRANASYLDADYVKAIDYYRQATQADPRFAMAFAKMALAQVNRAHYIGNSQPGWQVETGGWLNTALQLAPDLAEAHLAQGYYRYYAQQDLKGALSEFQAAQKLKPQDAAIYLGLGTIQKHLGDVKAAITSYSRGAELDPRNIDVLSELAVVELMQRNYLSAREVLQRAVAIDPSSMRVLINLVYSYTLSAGDIKSANAVLDAAPASLQSNSAMLVTRANLAFLAHDYVKAATLWADVKPGYLSQDVIESSQGDVEWAAGHSDAAKAHYERAVTLMQAVIAKQPSVANSMHGALGLNYARLGDNDKATELAQQSQQENPLSGDVPTALSTLLNTAQIQASLGHADAAVDALQRLFALPSGYIVSVPMLDIDPSWNPIRKDPGFQALLKKYSAAQSVDAGPSAAPQ